MQQLMEFVKETQNKYFDIKYEGKSCNYTKECTKVGIFRHEGDLVISLKDSSIRVRFKEIKDFYISLMTATIVLKENEKIFLKTC